MAIRYRVADGIPRSAKLRALSISRSYAPRIEKRAMQKLNKASAEGAPTEEQGNLIRFGPAGSAARFYDEGFTSSEQAPAWVAAQGLNAFEYSAGHGLRVSEKLGRKVGEAGRAHGVAISIHAPYFINCCAGDLATDEKAANYLLESARAVELFGGKRVIFHVGAASSLSRAQARANAVNALANARERLDEAGLAHISLCPETMGRASSFGNLDEVLALCELDGRMIPTLDFGHLHAAGAGALRSTEDFDRILERAVAALGYERMREFHAHFSKIAYTAKGEKNHVAFADEGYGPNFAHLVPVLVERRLEPVLICESKGMQADDAMAMKGMYEREKICIP